MGRHARDDDQPIASINITPLIDVVLVLLVVLIATTALALRVIPISTAEHAAPAAAEERVLAVRIRADGEIRIDGSDVDERGLTDRARAYVESLADPGRAAATIDAEDGASQARFVRVLDLLRRAGVRRLGIGARAASRRPLL